MDNRQQAVCDRIETKLVSLLKADPDWKSAADQIASALEVSEPEWSSPAAFVESLTLALPRLARMAVSRGQGPKDMDRMSSPLDLVNNLL